MTDAKHSVLMQKLNTDRRLSPHLIYLSRLEQVRAELTDDQLNAHGSSSGSELIYNIFNVTLCCDVSKQINLRDNQSKHEENMV